jgi:Uma2 family endonuclease
MTMTSSHPAWPSHGGDWTIEDLAELPDDNNRYEIRDARLLVTPPPPVPHFSAASLLAARLIKAAPGHLLVSTSPLGINIDRRRTYYIPDIVVVDLDIRKTRGGLAAEPSDLRLVVEVLSPSTRRHDLVAKRHDYAMAGIPQYWILDRDKETLTVLKLDETGKQYMETAVVRPGETWQTDEPFPVSFDLGEIL